LDGVGGVLIDPKTFKIETPAARTGKCQQGMSPSLFSPSFAYVGSSPFLGAMVEMGTYWGVAPGERGEGFAGGASYGEGSGGFHGWGRDTRPQQLGVRV